MKLNFLYIAACLLLLCLLAVPLFLSVEQKPTLTNAQITPTPVAIEKKPTRENFFREVLYAQATEITPLFDDYTEGSYHVDKLDVLKGLPEIAEKENLKLRGLMVIGPTGFLWGYYVIPFIEENGKIRVNSLSMPHARITFKATGTITEDDYQSFLTDILQTKIFSEELPPKGKCETCPYPEWHYEALLADWSGGKPKIYYGKINEMKPDVKTKLFEKKLNQVLSKLKKTYPSNKK
jgi:hypothetical protein